MTERKSLWHIVRDAALPVLVRATIAGLLSGLVLAGLLPVDPLGECLGPLGPGLSVW